jgi:hypothetical protein
MERSFIKDGKRMAHEMMHGYAQSAQHLQSKYKIRI